ncbi:MAG TPA: isoprenylcysteine carboxylmethyltransferase family protein [Flavobacteriales bacterium]|nr:isoprenylcysteine carboxylmethyltransferase family protein [Flavobacteriales bacterium]
MVQLVLSTAVFCALHSLLALDSVKRKVADRPGAARWYRLAYSLLSTLLLGWVVLAYLHADTEPPYWVLSPWLTVLAWALVVGGAALSGLAVMRFGAAGFLGLVPEQSTGLVRTGMHGRMRHPIYTGIIGALAGWVLLHATPATLVVVGIQALYLPIGIHLEERKLIAAFGEEYQRYRREVPALIPRLGSR